FPPVSIWFEEPAGTNPFPLYFSLLTIPLAVPARMTDGSFLSVVAAVTLKSADTLFAEPLGSTWNRPLSVAAIKISLPEKLMVRSSDN
ncbi:MAG TPA: hypothetical protein VLQ76_07070, partial [Bacteroidales bacterium]|nr:hypothetical protein [Bacteroidales bacterium]